MQYTLKKHTNLLKKVDLGKQFWRINATSTFSVLFYANKSKLKNSIVPIMGRVTINGTQSQFSCKQSILLTYGT